MKSRELSKVLGTTRQVHIDNNKICIASSYIHDLLFLDLESMKIIYKLDTWKEGRSALKNKEELGLIWDKLQELVDNNKIQYYVDGDDEIEDPIPAFTFVDKETLIETSVESGKLCYPNITANGLLIYDNTFFATRKEAIEDKIESFKYYIENDKERIIRRKRDLQDSKDILSRDEKVLLKLKEMLVANDE